MQIIVKRQILGSSQVYANGSVDVESQPSADKGQGRGIFSQLSTVPSLGFTFRLTFCIYVSYV